MKASTPQHDARVTAALKAMRHMAWTGQPILQHRALRIVSRQRHEWLMLLMLPLAANAALYAFWDDLCLYFMGGLYFFLDPLIPGLRFGGVDMPLIGGRLFVPMINTLPPDNAHWWMGFLVTGLLLLLTHLRTGLPIPLRYVLGFLAYLQIMAQLYFARMGYGANANPQDYLADVMLASCYWIWCSPWLLTMTFNLFPFTLIHKLRITALIVLYQVFMFPVQYAFQAWILHEASSLWMPLLYFVASVPLNIFTTLAIYAIGMSWPGSVLERAR